MTRIEGHASARTAIAPKLLSGEAARRLLLGGLPVKERRLELAGISTAVLEGGEGPPVVLLHGPGEYAAKWLRIIPGLVKTHRVIAPDLPGHGASEGIDAPLDAERVRAWVGDLIEQMCETQPILVGQIVGGAIAARFAAAHSERLRCLVLSDALGLAPFRPTPEFGAALTAFVMEPSAENHDRLWQRCAFDLDTLRKSMGESWDRIRAYNVDRAQATGLKPTQQSLMEQFGLPAIAPTELSRITVPTILIWGRHDLATPLPVAEAASARYGWPLHVIEDAADDPPIEQPEAFMRALRSALGSTINPNSEISKSPSDAPEARDRFAPGYDRADTETQQAHRKVYGGTPAENYQRFFVPSIGAPVADDLIGVAGLRPGQRVLDVACGTGVVTRRAAQRVGAAGAVAGLDVNRGMLAVARSQTPPDISIDWYEASAESMPLADEAFDVVLCQMGLQFVPNKLAALREMRRVVHTGGRAFVTVPGPKPPMFAVMTEALARHLSPKAASFVDLVFSMHNVDELTELMRGAGFREIDVQSKPKTLRLPASADFLWQYIYGTPLAEAAAQVGEARRDALERDVCVQWQEFAVDGSMLLQVGMTTATALK